MNFPLRGKFNIADTVALDLTRVDITENRIIRDLAWFPWGWESGQEEQSLYMARFWNQIQAEAQVSWPGLQRPPWSGSFISPHSPTCSLSCHHPTLQTKSDPPSLPCSYSVWNGQCPFNSQTGLPLCACLSLTPGAAGGQGGNPIHVHMSNSNPRSADRDPGGNSKTPERRLVSNGIHFKY